MGLPGGTPRGDTGTTIADMTRGHSKDASLAASALGIGTQVAAPPLDYSFKELKSVLEMETEEPRSGGKRKPQAEKDPAVDQTDAAPDAAAMGTTGGASEKLATGTLPPLVPVGAVVANCKAVKRTVKKVTMAVKLNNNSIDSVTELSQALQFVMDDPLRNLQWIDLSFNRLAVIGAELLDFKQMKALYLHGNHIKSLPSVERLRKLPKLISLTLNGNPIECFPFYRRYVVGSLPDLRTLDHLHIVEDEVRGAQDWFGAHQERARIRRERIQDALLAANE